MWLHNLSWSLRADFLTLTSLHTKAVLLLPQPAVSFFFFFPTISEPNVP